MKERLENSDVRLKTFLHRLNTREPKYFKSDSNLTSENGCKVLLEVKLAKIILPMFGGNKYERLIFQSLF